MGEPVPCPLGCPLLSGVCQPAPSSLLWTRPAAEPVCQPAHACGPASVRAGVCTGTGMRVSVRVAVCALCLGTLCAPRVPLRPGTCCPPSPMPLPELRLLSPSPVPLSKLLSPIPCALSPCPSSCPLSPVPLPKLLSPEPLPELWLLSPVPCAPTHAQLYPGAQSERDHSTNPSSAHPSSTGWHLGGTLPVPAPKAGAGVTWVGAGLLGIPAWPGQPGPSEGLCWPVARFYGPFHAQPGRMEINKLN